MVITGCQDKASDRAEPSPDAPDSTAAAADPAQRLAERFAPLVYLARGDKFGPTTAEEFLASSDLMFSNTPGCPDPVVASDVDPSLLTSGYSEYESIDRCSKDGKTWRTNESSKPSDRDGIGFYLNLDDSAYGGAGVSSPAYVQYERGSYVMFWLLYARNDAPSGPVYLFDHEGDWERVAVLLDKQDEPRNVVYFGHEGKCKVPWSDAPKEQGHPVAYSAKGTHASYPEPGTHRAGIDETSAGNRWQTWEKLRFVADEPWRGYGGGWGDVGQGEHATGPAGPHLNRDVSSVHDAPLCGASDIDRSLYGTWKSIGNVQQPSADQKYSAELTIYGGNIGEVVGRSYYPGLECRGEFTLEETRQSGRQIVVRESTIPDPADTCLDETVIELTYDMGELRYEARAEGLSATARLKQR
jgi:hypothetical protein